LLAQTWTAISAVTREAFIPAKAGRIVLLASREDAGVVKAALENLARTLSVEWARHGITTTAIAPGPSTTDEELATVIAYLCSEAGAYFSGCRFDVR
jgi:NAD(P)-dependent dehydrogenase (short-subunit alcohol dehydrogenase family)